MKKVIAFCMAFAISSSLMACSSKESSHSMQPEPSSHNNSSDVISSSRTSSVSDEKSLLSKISVTYTDDGLPVNGKTPISVSVNNGTGKVFSGNVQVEFKSNGKQTGSGTISIEKVNPGRIREKNIDCDSDENLTFSYHFDKITFSELPPVSKEKVLADKSKAIKQDLDYDFGPNAGDTDWYHKITKIEVCTNGPTDYAKIFTSYATFIPDSDTKGTENIKTMAEEALAWDGDDLYKTIIIDAHGVPIYEKDAK